MVCRSPGCPLCLLRVQIDNERSSRPMYIPNHFLPCIKCALRTCAYNQQPAVPLDDMKQAAKDQLNIQDEAPRRSSRQRKELKCDYYVMSQGNYQGIQDWDIDEEEGYSPKHARRRRKDSEDFEGRVIKKRNNVNRVVNLLGWKLEAVLPDPPAQGTFAMHRVKNIPKTDLAKQAHKVEAIFINIKWKGQPPHEKQGVSFKDFKQLNLESNALTDNGLIFIWTESVILGELMDIMGTKGFSYVENFQIGLLDLAKGREELAKSCTLKTHISSKSIKKSKIDTSSSDTIEQWDEEVEASEKEEFLRNMSKLGHVDPESIFMQFKGGNNCFSKGKIELTIFKKNNNKKSSLELRHQRTSDTIFDIVSQRSMGIDKVTKNFVYEMIQTMLPRAMDEGNLKLLELWGDKDCPRRGWVTLVET